jgi:hypothetical protein
MIRVDRRLKHGVSIHDHAVSVCAGAGFGTMGCGSSSSVLAPSTLMGMPEACAAASRQRRASQFGQDCFTCRYTGCVGMMGVMRGGVRERCRLWRGFTVGP